MLTFLIGTPQKIAQVNWKQAYLKALLTSSRLSPGLKQFTFFSGGPAGNIDQHNDILDVILKYVTSVKHSPTPNKS